MKLRIAFPIILVLSAMLLSACGLGANAARPSPSADPQRAMLAWAQCMRQHGVDVPDPGASGSVSFSGSNTDQATMNAAMNACQSKLRGVKGGKTPSPQEQAQMRDAAVKYAQCMRQHGIDMPDPQFSGSGAIQRVGGGVDPTSAAFQAADKACNHYLPFRPGTSTSHSGSGSGSGGTFSVQGGS